MRKLLTFNRMDPTSERPCSFGSNVDPPGSREFPSSNRMQHPQVPLFSSISSRVVLDSASLYFEMSKLGLGFFCRYNMTNFWCTIYVLNNIFLEWNFNDTWCIAHTHMDEDEEWDFLPDPGHQYLADWPSFLPTFLPLLPHPSYLLFWPARVGQPHFSAMRGNAMIHRANFESFLLAWIDITWYFLHLLVAGHIKLGVGQAHFPQIQRNAT